MTTIYAIFDPARLGASLDIEQSGTTLLCNAVATADRAALTLQPKSAGLWYAELLVYGPDDLLSSVGIATHNASLTAFVGADAHGWGYRMDLGKIYHNGVSVYDVPDADTNPAKVGDMIGLLLDMTGSQPTLRWTRNGVPVYTAALTSFGPWVIAGSLGDAGVGSPPVAGGMRMFLNSGQRAFEYPPAQIVSGGGWYDDGDTLQGIRLASEDWLSPAGDDVPNQRYDGLIDGGSNELRAVRSLDFWPWQRGINSGAMTLTCLNADGVFDEILSQDSRDLAVTVARVDTSGSYGDRVGLFSAIIDSASAADDLTVKLTCRDLLGLLDVPAQRWLIRPDADPAAANQPRPIMLGACRNVPAVLIDAPTLTYVVSDAAVLGIGYVRDSGYPLDPAADPADFKLGGTKMSVILNADPQGKITADLSSVGGDQLPDPTTDILGGNGDPLSGADGDAPDGMLNGGDTPPVMAGGVLTFPQISVSSTIRITGQIATSAFASYDPINGGATLRVTWRDAGGNELGYTDGTRLTGTNANNTYTIDAEAPGGSVYANVEYTVYGHSGGTATFGPMQAWYVMSDASLVAIPIVDPDFADASGWTGEASPGGNLWQFHAGYVVKQPDTGPNPGTDGKSRALRNHYLAPDIPSTTGIGWLKLTSVTKYGSGKSYRVTVTIPSLPDGFYAIALATGTTIDSIIAEWKTAGTYTLTITNSDGVDHDLYLLGVPLRPGSVPVPPNVSDITIGDYDDSYHPDPRSTAPANLLCIKLADYVAEMLDRRASAIGMEWSLADAQAIDTASGYAGIGVYAASGETVSQLLDLALASYTACKWVDGEGQLRFTRMIGPGVIAEEDRAGTIDINAMGGDLVPLLDTAPGLTTQMGVRRNWAELSDGDLVEASTNFPLGVRQGMLKPYQINVSTARVLAGAYHHAQYAAAVGSCFDQQADGQAEIDRIANIYAKPRWFYSVSVELEALPGIDLGQVWTLVYGRYGLAEGKAVMVIDFEPDLLAGTANIILWG